jgi:hypothetical protein
VGSSSDSATVQLGLRENLSQFALLVVINAANLPAAPPNFASIVELNEAGEFRPLIRLISKPAPIGALGDSQEEA